MKIVRYTKVVIEHIETDEDEHYEYRRYSADNWEVAMGCSWEIVARPEELEAAFQNCGLETNHHPDHRTNKL